MSDRGLIATQLKFGIILQRLIYIFMNLNKIYNNLKLMGGDNSVQSQSQ
jgi:hypothetical protein